MDSLKLRDDQLATLLEMARLAGVGATFDERMAALAPLVSRLIPRARVAAAVHDPEARQPADPAWYFAAGGVGPGVIAPYAERYQELDPLRAVQIEANGRPHLLSDTEAGRRYGQDPFTAEFLAGLGIRHLLLSCHRMPDGSVLSLALHRGPDQPDFDAAERALLATFAPDVARSAAAAVLRRIVESHPSEAGRAPTAHAVVFDTCGRVVHGDLGALQLLDAKSSGQLASEVAALCAARSATGTVLERVLGQAGGAGLPSRLVALDPRSGLAAMVVLSHEPTDSRFERLIRDARLTARERQVAALAIEGLRNRDIANRLGVGVDTVKWHLKTIFQKTKVQGRGGLAAIVLGRG